MHSEWTQILISRSLRALGYFHPNQPPISRLQGHVFQPSVRLSPFLDQSILTTIFLLWRHCSGHILAIFRHSAPQFSSSSADWKKFWRRTTVSRPHKGSKMSINVDTADEVRRSCYLPYRIFALLGVTNSVGTSMQTLWTQCSCWNSRTLGDVSNVLYRLLPFMWRRVGRAHSSKNYPMFFYLENVMLGTIRTDTKYRIPQTKLPVWTQLLQRKKFQSHWFLLITHNWTNLWPR